MSGSPAGASRRTVTVLFCDVVDSTPLAERLDIETYRRVQRSYFDAVRGVLERHGGTVEKFIGDAVMAVFGLPTLHEDDALRALRGACELREAIAPIDEELANDHGLRLRLRVGIATGEVVAGDPAEGSSFATGETVVVAERIQRAARPSEVLIAHTTYRLASGAAVVEPVDPVPAKGIAEPVAAWRLIGVQADAPAVARRLDTPLVGRRRELARLRAAYDEVDADQTCRLVAVLGPAGIGKSRLVREFVRDVSAEATVRVGRCPAYGDGITFWPVADVLPEETFQGTTDEIFLRVRKELEQLARERPLVVCFDDVHWGEPTFLSLLEYLAGWIEGVPVLVVCMSRPELLELRPLPWSDVITLQPLSAGDAEQLLDVLGAPSDGREQIAEAAEGNPLFVEQMIAMAADTGGQVAVPESIRALLAARLDRLTPEERTAIERAAVIGREFPLAAVTALSDSQAAEPLLALVRKELLRPAVTTFEDGLSFRHALIREAAYEATPKALRAELHERHGRWLAERGGADIVVGFHLEQAYLLVSELGRRNDDLALEAGRLLAAAGRRAFDRDDMPAAVNLLERAVTLLRSYGEPLSVLLTELGSTLFRAGLLDDAAAAFDQALDVARRTGDRRGELRALVERQQLRLFAAPATADETADVASRAIAELESLGDDLGLAKAWRLASEVHLVACRWRARSEALERALMHARRVPEARQETTMLMLLLSQALHYGPTPVDEAIEQCRVFIAEADDRPALEAGIGITLASLLAMQGAFDEARERYRDSVALQEELGLRLRRATRTLDGAQIEILAGDLEAAERELRLGCSMLEEMHESGVRAVIAAHLAAVLCEQGKDEEAGSVLEIAARIAEEDDLASQVVQCTTRARLLVRAGDAERAEPAAAKAVELAEPTDFPALQADAYVALATVRAYAGADDEARRLLERAHAVHDDKGNVVAAARLAEALVRL